MQKDNINKAPRLDGHDRKRIAEGLQAAVCGVAAVVAEYASGLLPPPPAVSAGGVDKIHRRFAPHFAEGRAGRVAYTLVDVANQIGSLGFNGKPSRWMRVAQQVLEAFELGFLSQETFDLIVAGRSPWSVAKLRRVLIERKRVWAVQNRPELTDASLVQKGKRLLRREELQTI